jgi:hypothetical protein
VEGYQHDLGEGKDKPYTQKVPANHMLANELITRLYKKYF